MKRARSPVSMMFARTPLLSSVTLPFSTMGMNTLAMS